MVAPSGLLKTFVLGTLGASIVAAWCHRLSGRGGAGGQDPGGFPETTAYYFAEMDGGVALSPNEAPGRNT
jgi:hypothetical protein